MNEPKKKKKNPVMIIVLIIAICVFIFAGYNLISILTRYKTANDSYDKVSNLFETVEIEDAADSFDTEGDAASDPSEASGKKPAKKNADAVPFKWDYKKLVEMNPDAIGWIYEKDLLNYPIVQGSDNDYYLHTLFDGTANPSGTLFVDYNMKKGLKGLYSIVYGHNMNDGSMFGVLHQYEQDKDCYKKHPTMHIFIGEQHYIYNVVAAYTADVNGFTYNDPLNNADVTDFIKKARDASIAPMYDGKITDDTNIIVLSTCTTASDDEYRFVVILSRDHEVKE